MLHLNCTAFSQLELSIFFFLQAKGIIKKNFDFYYFFHKLITIYVLFEKIK